MVGLGDCPPTLAQWAHRQNTSWHGWCAGAVQEHATWRSTVCRIAARSVCVPMLARWPFGDEQIVVRTHAGVFAVLGTSGIIHSSRKSF